MSGLLLQFRKNIRLKKYEIKILYVIITIGAGSLHGYGMEVKLCNMSAG